MSDFIVSISVVDAIKNEIVLRVYDTDESKKQRAIRVLRKAIQDTRFRNADIYAQECYTVINGVACTYLINKDLAEEVIKQLKSKYQIKVKEV